MDGVELIAFERQRQINQERFDAEHDDEHGNGELAKAAVCYALKAATGCFGSDFTPIAWPWEPSWWKPSGHPIRNLVKAGALIAAEIDRLQRCALQDKAKLEAHQRVVAIAELKKQPVSDPEKLMRCNWCGLEMPKSQSGICDDCCPF